ncbi:MAG TPA: PBP1A family penicillin-binding protein [Gemmatimonadaceae bacterium]|nr:PBP1A family penicillin-binding protein [Gemmatimonadaceae bacterium]
MRRSWRALVAVGAGVALGAPAAHGQQADQEIACAPRLGATPSEAWQIVPLPQSSLVYARDGSLIGEIGLDWRTDVSLSALPKYVPEAFIAVEDKRFYQHDGVDLVGIAGALKDAVTEGDVRGASTITQLLVGNMHPDLINRRDRGLDLSGISRKLHEQAAAREMEKHYNKAQILEAFLNTINFGHRWCGIEEAARHYFGRHASQLTIAQAASLAALPKSPAGYDPARHPARNKERRDLILGLMAGQGYITARQAADARAEPVVTAPDAGFAVHAPYFVDAVKQAMQAAGVPITTGGLRIYTTDNPALQRDAQQALVDGIAKVEARPNYHHPKYDPRHPDRMNVLQGMVVAVDPYTGDVEALVGGRDYATSPYDRAVNAARQPGSSFKPFVYAKALEDGITANAIVPDTALSIVLPTGDVYQPRDDDGKFLGPMTIREGLIHSRNSVAVQLGQMVGMDSVAALAHRMGIATPIDPVPSSAIGASVVKPLDFVAAYAAFANNGLAVTPRLVTRVDDRYGRTVYTAPDSTPQRVLDPGVAFIVRDMLKDAAERGTGRVARQMVSPDIPIAGKTGTTNDNVDVWFVGMTPRLVAGVWLGFDQPSPIALNVAGGSLAAPVWGEMIDDYYSGRSAGSFPPAGDLVAGVYDRASGTPATYLTPPDNLYTEFFLPGTGPLATRGDPWKVPQWGALLIH